jgi:TatD DNase family protein
MFIDTHCHLDWDSYQEDFTQVLGRAKEAGVSKIITIGVDEDSNRRTRALTKHEMISRCVGFHPDIVLKEGFDTSEINRLMKDFSEELSFIKTVGIGECGLDYYTLDREGVSAERKKELIELQKDLFERQILVAIQHGMPLSLHVRDDSEQAYEDVAELLAEYFTDEVDYSKRSFEILLPDLTTEKPGTAKLLKEEKPVPGVLHCVSGPEWYIQHCLEMGFMVSFAGNITFKNAENIVKIAESTPLDRIVLETDGPFLAPLPNRGKRNESAYIVQIAQKIADSKGVTIDEVGRQTTINAKRLFNLN